MSTRIRRFAAAVAATLLLAGALVPGSALASGSQAEAANASVPFDVLVMRPVGFVTLGIGTGLFVGTLPLMLITRPTDIGISANHLIGRPARFLWKDSLGGH